MNRKHMSFVVLSALLCMTAFGFLEEFNTGESLAAGVTFDAPLAYNCYFVTPTSGETVSGTYLIDFIEQDCSQRGFSYLTLNVAKVNLDALRLYERLGYRVIGSRPGRWSFRDDLGQIQHVNEPSWRLIKRITSL